MLAHHPLSPKRCYSLCSRQGTCTTSDVAVRSTKLCNSLRKSPWFACLLCNCIQPLIGYSFTRILGDGKAIPDLRSEAATVSSGVLRNAWFPSRSPVRDCIFWSPMECLVSSSIAGLLTSVADRRGHHRCAIIESIVNVVYSSLVRGIAHPARVPGDNDIVVTVDYVFVEMLGV